MDNLTHSLVGALIGQAGLKRKTGLAMPALIIGANLPDVDAACFFWLEGVEHLAFRRGITHGPPAWVLLPLILAGLLWGLDRWQAGRGKRPEARLPVHFGWLYALAFIGCLSHPALDWLNTYGIRLLEPFSSRWFHGDVLFIIDPWLWAGLIFGIWLSLRQEKRGHNWRRTGGVALSAVFFYIAVNAAFTAGHEYGAQLAAPEAKEAIASPVPFAFWRRESIVGGDGFYRIDGTPLGLRSIDAAAKADLIAAQPQAAPLLFWSQMPVVARGEGGVCLLGDARFWSSPAGGSRFTVPLPVRFCGPE